MSPRPIIAVVLAEKTACGPVTGWAGHGRARKSQRCSSGGAARAGEEIDQVIIGEADERLQLRCRH